MLLFRRTQGKLVRRVHCGAFALEDRECVLYILTETIKRKEEEVVEAPEKWPEASKCKYLDE